MLLDSTNRGPIFVEYIVIMASATPQEEVSGVDYVQRRGMNYDYLKELMQLKSSHMWGLKIIEGVMQPVELSLPLDRTLNLDGFSSIYKGHKIFQNAEAGDDHHQIAKAHLVKSLEAVFPNPITAENA